MQLLQLKIAHKAVGETVKNQFKQGDVPHKMGLEGHLALMHYKIQQWMETRDDSLLESLAADAVWAVARVVPELPEIVEPLMEDDLDE